MLPLVFALLLEVELPLLPGQEPGYPKPPDSISVKYFELLERNTHIVYPVLGIIVLVLIAAGIMQAWRTQDIDGLEKAELKREVILELRKDTYGLSAEQLNRKIKIEKFKLVKLLEQMQQDGILVSTTDTQRLTTWRLKGIGPEGR